MGTRRLEVVISGDAKSLSRAFGQTSRDLDQMDSRTKRAGRSLAAFGVRAAATGALIGGAGLAAGLAMGTRELLAQEKASARTRNVLETTGGVANVTAEQVENLASALQSQTGTADDAIQSSANLLLTFTRVRNEAGKGNDIFNQGVAIANDLSVALGTDLNSATILVGKALQDPVRGMTALRRAGVQLNEQQEEQVKAFMESGNVLGAQKIILGELETQFKGAASSEGEATEALQQFQRGAEDAAESLAASLLPAVMSVIAWWRRNWPEIQRVTERVFRGVQAAAQRTMAWLDTNIVPIIRGIVAAARAFWSRFGDDVTRIFNLIRTVIGAQLRIIAAVINGVLAVIRGDWGKAWASLKTAVSSAKTAVVAILRGMPAIVFGIATEIGRAIISGIASAIMAGAGAIAAAARSVVNSAVRAAINAIPGVSVSGGNGSDGGRQVPGSAEETIANPMRLDSLSRGGVAAGGGRRGAAPGSSLDLERTRSSNQRSEQDARSRSEEEYIRTRLANIATLQAKLDTAYRRVEDQIQAKKRDRGKIKVPRQAGPKRRKALQDRAKINQAIRDLQDQLETIWQEHADLAAEAADLGGELNLLQRSAQEDAEDAALDAAVAEAALTPGLDDDLAAAQAVERNASDELAAARASGDQRRIADAARAYARAKADREQIEALMKNTDAVNGLNDTMKQSFGGSVAFSFRGQGYVLGSLAPPSSDRLTGAEVGI